MAEDKKISELPGVTPQAVVALTRDGLVTVADLLAADFDRVAYLTEDYNEAARLVREAAKEVPGTFATKKGRPIHDGPGFATPVMRSPLKGKESAPAPQAEAATVSPAPPPRPLKSKEAAAKPAPAPSPKEKSEMREPKLGEAMGAALRGLSLGADEAGVQGRAMLRRRLAVACLLLEHGADEAEMAAALILEGAEEGALPVEEIAQRFGKPVEKLIEECASLRAVPLLPSGKLPRYYTDMAKAASGAARRICAAYLLESDRRGQAEWHARMLVQGLTAGEPEELVTLAQRTVLPGAREAA